jgi:hypothetical protein
MVLETVTITALGTTQDPYIGVGFPYRNYLVTGNASLAANVSFTPSVSVAGASFSIRWEADVTVNTFSVSICGIVINQSDVNQNGLFNCYYDGSAWSVQYYADGTDQPQIFYGVTNVTAPTSGTITLTAGVDKFYQRLIGAPTVLAGNLVVTANTAGVKDGTQFFVQVAGSITLGVNALTIFGLAINSIDAASGNAMVIATFDAGANVWRAQYIRGSFGLSNLGEIAATTVVGNPSSLTAQPVAIAASSNGRLLVRRSNTLSFQFLDWENFGTTNLFTPKFIDVQVLSAAILTSGSTPVMLLDQATAQGVPVFLGALMFMSSGGSAYATHTNIGIRYAGSADDIASYNGALAITGNTFFDHHIIPEAPTSGASAWGGNIEFYTKSGNPTGGTRTLNMRIFFSTVPPP